MDALYLADSSWTEPQVLAAFVAGAFSVVALIWNLLIAHSLEKRKNDLKLISDTLLESHKNSLDLEKNRKLQELKADLDKIANVDKARLDYEYEARKKLYEEVEPLLFQLGGLAEGAMHRIAGLARTSRIGHLEEGESWLESDPYYLRSTIYQLLAPMAAMRLIQSKLTAVDLNLDETISKRYLICRQVYLSFTDAYQLARGGLAESDREKSPHSIPYLPHDFNPKNAKDAPEIYCRQGLPIGMLDKVVDLLILTDGDHQRCINFGEFDELFEGASSKKLDRVVEIFQTFNPKTRPVLWRMLVVQYHLHRAIFRASRLFGAPDPDSGNVRIMPTAEREILDWRPLKDMPSTETDAEVLNVPFEVTEAYLNATLGRQHLFQTLNAGSPPHPDINSTATSV